MKFLSISRPNPKAAYAPPSPENMAELIRLREEAEKSGVLLFAGGLFPIAQGGACVRTSGGETTVIDGPFAEAKEMIGGFAIIEADSKEAAVELQRRLQALTGVEGETEMRQIM